MRDLRHSRSKMRLGFPRVAKSLVLYALTILITSAMPAAAGDYEIFGHSSRAASGLSLFPKWAGAIRRYWDDDAMAGSICRGNVFRNCMSEEWKTFLDTLRNEGSMRQIRAVNDRLNRAKYTLDINNYVQSDYWAAPNEFFHFDGDCEDYAIAKYFSLRALGFNSDSLRIVVLEDLNLRVAHAILAVTIDGRSYVLDNQISQVINENVIHHYKPIYSINEERWWLHYKQTRR